MGSSSGLVRAGTPDALEVAQAVEQFGGHFTPRLIPGTKLASSPTYDLGADRESRKNLRISTRRIETVRGS
jgi:hypothetical protein